MTRKKVIQYRHGPIDTFPALRLGFVELVAKYNDLVRDYNEFAAEPVSFLALVDKPDTLAGYGIIDAAPLHHKHTVADIEGLPPGSSIVHWNDIHDTPTTLEGYGIVNAAHLIHTHHWADIVDPPAFGGAGPQGPPGLTIPGTEVAPAIEPLIVQGPKGDRGPRGLMMPALDGKDGQEPMMIPGQRGAAGPAGPPGAGGGGTATASHEGVLAFGESRQQEPAFGMGIPGAPGFSEHFAFQGEWSPAFGYFANDVVLYRGDLYLEFKIPDPPGTTPLDPASNWVLFLPGGRIGPPGIIPEVAKPLEPMMVPGPKGATGAAGGGGGALALLTTEVNLRAAPACARGGKFTIAGAGMTIGKPVLIQQAAGPYTGKGTRADEAEMDNIEVRAYVKTAALIEAFWSSRTRVRGNFKFNYAVST